MKRKALVTGGSRGMGRIICDELRSKSIDVFAPNRSELDLSSVESIDKYLNNFHEPIDILINNAGVNYINNISNIALNEWQEILMINLTAPFMLLKHFLPKMEKQGWGRVVNVSSIWGVVGKEGRAAYSSAKTGLHGLTRVAAIEYSKSNILVNNICPGFVNTELTSQNNSPEQIKSICDFIPQGRLAEPSEIAKFVSFLVSQENTFITGQSISIDGGFTIK